MTKTKKICLSGIFALLLLVLGSLLNTSVTLLIKKIAFSQSPPPPSTKTQPAVLGAVSENARGEHNAGSKFPARMKKIKFIQFDDISAKAFLVADADTFEVLMEKQAGQNLPIASLTKIMTALLAYELLDVNQYYQISSDDNFSVQPVLHLRSQDSVKVLHLIEATLVCSANDAAKALAHAVERNTQRGFVNLMNEKAAELNLLNTHFSNPLGFDSDNNYSTASDLLTLSARIQKLAVFKNLGRRKTVSFVSQNGFTYSCGATNKLIAKDPTIEVVKTGFTDRAKGSMIAKINRQGRSVLIIILGSEQRETDLLKLADLTFQNFEW